MNHHKSPIRQHPLLCCAVALLILIAAYSIMCVVFSEEPLDLRPGNAVVIQSFVIHHPNSRQTIMNQEFLDYISMCIANSPGGVCDLGPTYNISIYSQDGSHIDCIMFVPYDLDSITLMFPINKFFTDSSKYRIQFIRPLPDYVRSVFSDLASP